MGRYDEKGIIDVPGKDVASEYFKVRSWRVQAMKLLSGAGLFGIAPIGFYTLPL